MCKFIHPHFFLFHFQEKLRVAELRVAFCFAFTVCCSKDSGRNPQPATFIGFLFFVCIPSICIGIYYVYIFIYSIYII